MTSDPLYQAVLPYYRLHGIALLREETFREMARENQGKRNDLSQISAESQAPIDTREELAKAARTSHGTLAKAKTINGGK